jgi:glycosyltransferase involved in cell wall biosynthesis
MNLLFILPNPSKASSSLKELVDRHILYISKIKEIEPKLNLEAILLVGKRGNLTELVECDSLKLRYVPKSLRLLPFSIGALITIKSMGFKPTWIISGDPYFSFLRAIIMKFFLSRKIHIQVSFHGEIEQLLGKSMKNSLKLLLLSLSYRFADLIRFVSNSQEEDVAKYFKYERRKTVVVPVPINQLESKSSLSQTNCVAFVGRLHEERGIEEWVAITTQIRSLNQLIIGDGPMADDFKKICPKGEFLGSISNRQVQQQWKRVSILLSTAPFESYGLSMREALLHNVPVVSRRNLGSMELHSKYPQLVAIYESEDQAVLLIEKLIEIQRKGSNEAEFVRFRMNFFAEQDQSLNRLAQSWINAL